MNYNVYCQMGTMPIIAAQTRKRTTLFLRILNGLTLGLIFLLGGMSPENTWAQCTPPPNPTATTTPTYCNTNNGSLSFTNASPQLYDYSIDGGTTYQASATFLNLAQGAKQTRIRYKTTLCQSAIVTQTVAFTASPSSTLISATVANVTNCTAANGSISFAGPTPLTSYNFSVNGGQSFQSSPAFTGLAAGTYQLVVQSALTGCVSTTTTATQRTLTLTGTPVSPTTTSTPSYCTTPNGTISFTAPTPLANYQFSVNGGATYQDSPTVLNLATGNYLTRIRAKTTGCESATVSRAVSLTAAPVSTAIVATTANVTNCTATNGSITFTAPTPLASYAFSIDGGQNFQSSPAFTGLAVGNYQLVVQSAITGCVSTTTTATRRTLILTGAPVNPTTTSTPSYCTTPNGTISFSAPTPLANYQFSVDGGTTYQNSQTFLNLAAGTYRTRIRARATGCESATVTQTVSLTAAPASTAIVATTANVTNCTATNGSITFTAPTPLASYAFSIDGGRNFQSSPAFTGLAAGTYQLVVQSAITGCVSTTTTATQRTLTVATASIPATPNGTSTPSGCTLATGTITFTTPTPTTSFLFSVNGGTTFGNANQVLFDSLTPGVYTTVAQSRTTGCLSATRAITVQPVVAVPTPVATLFRPTDCNNPNGSITFTSPASSPPATIYAYSIDGGETFGDPASTVFSGLLPGVYGLVAMQLSTGCMSAVSSVTLVANPAIGLPVSSITNMSECNPRGGAIMFSAPTPLTNYQFSIDGGQTYGPANQFTFSNLTVGTYPTLARLISSGCVSDTVVKVLSYTLPVVSLTVTAQNQDPCVATNGSISIAASGGTGVYEYSLNGGQTYTNLTQNPLTVSNLSTGNYTVVLRDKNSIICIDQEVVSLEAADCPVPIPLVKD